MNFVNLMSTIDYQSLKMVISITMYRAIVIILIVNYKNIENIIL